MDLAFERVGAQIAWQCDNDPACQKILRKHFEVPWLYPDIREAADEEVDVLFGGFPCQDVSVAGGRAGLAGERSGLFFEFARIAGELEPEWVLIENVPGLLSSHKGADMSTILGHLAELGYGWAYRVLDAQYFGVPQRRRRVFIVGCLGDPRRASKVLFEPTCGKRHPQTRRTQRTHVTGPLMAGSNGSGWRIGADEAVSGQVIPTGSATNGNAQDSAIPALAPALTAQRGQRYDPNEAAYLPVYRKSTRPHSASEGDRWRQTDHASTISQWELRHSPPAHLAVSIYPKTGQGSVLGATEIELSPSLTADGERIHDRGTRVVGELGVRRLTPLECERLQGFPDGWSEGLADSVRYRLLGNAVAVPVMEWIARRMWTVM